jgi:hypothetical protein
MNQDEQSLPLSGLSNELTQQSESLILPRSNDQNINPVILLKQREGSSIKRLIDRNSSGSFKNYCDKIGFTPSNFHAILSGDRPCSLEKLNHILSGIRYHATISTTIVIQAMPTGRDAENAASLLDEDTLPLDETGLTVLEEPTQSDSYSSETPQNSQILSPDDLLQEFQDGL